MVICSLINVQCAIPVFDGLLPDPHNSQVLDLLFLLAHWHGLAKLRIHTDLTLDILDQTTTSLGKTLRDFQRNTCSAYNTRELVRESNARQRKKARVTKQTKKKNDQLQATPTASVTISGTTTSGELTLLMNCCFFLLSVATDPIEPIHAPHQPPMGIVTIASESNGMF